MKIIRTVALVFSVLGFFSCEDYLEEELTGGLTSGVLDTEDGIRFGLNGVYSSFTELMGNGNQREDGWSLTTMGTDIIRDGSDAGNARRYNNYNAELQADHSFLRSSWDDMYRGINTANAIISRAPNVIENQDDLNNILGQAHFLRGYYYFWLVRQFGDVHLTLEETIGVETEANRTPVAQIYQDAIIPDLQFAADNLPRSQDDRGRVTSWAARTALAEVHLTLRNYDEALAFAEDVINNGPFSLVTPFSDLWSLDNHDNNSELIYSVQYAADPLFDATGNPAHLFFLMKYDQRDGMRRDLANGRPFTRFRPTDYLLNLFDSDMDDQRFDGSFRSVWFANDPGGLPDGLAVGDTAVYFPRVALSQVEKDARPFGGEIYNRDELTNRIFPSLSKWEQPNRIDVNSDSGDRDFIVYRYADVLLMAAEASALKPAPDQTRALEYLNEVRMRAYGVTDVAALPPIASVDIDVILEERAKEFVGEGKRWYDLKRTGTLVERVRLHNPGGSENIQDFHVLRPIPLAQIDRTTNEYPQNPGY